MSKVRHEQKHLQKTSKQTIKFERNETTENRILSLMQINSKLENIRSTWPQIGLFNIVGFALFFLNI